MKIVLVFFLYYFLIRTRQVNNFCFEKKKVFPQKKKSFYIILSGIRMPKLHKPSLGHPGKKEPNFLLSGKLTPSLRILNGNFSISSLIMLLRICNLYYYIYCLYCLHHFVATIIVFISKLP